MALSWLAAAGIDWDDDLAPVAHALAAGEHHLPAVRRQQDSGLNAPPTSSAGRLFDAAAALAGVRQTVNYEAQAAVEFEALCDADEDAAYPFVYANAVIDPRPALAALVADIRAGLPIGRLSARFHNGFARLAYDVCRALRADTGLSEVVLSGGVWQNMTLLRASYHLLASDGFTVLIHEQVPANDGGLALGQAAVAAWALRHAHDERQGRRPAASPHETRQQQPLTTA
jgi:hydrogenase maturation protein HypF